MVSGLQGLDGKLNFVPLSRAANGTQKPLAAIDTRDSTSLSTEAARMMKEESSTFSATEAKEFAKGITGFRRFHKEEINLPMLQKVVTQERDIHTRYEKLTNPTPEETQADHAAFTAGRDFGGKVFSKLKANFAIISLNPGAKDTSSRLNADNDKLSVYMKGIRNEIEYAKKHNYPPAEIERLEKDLEDALQFHIEIIDFATKHGITLNNFDDGADAVSGVIDSDEVAVSSGDLALFSQIDDELTSITKELMELLIKNKQENIEQNKEAARLLLAEKQSEVRDIEKNMLKKIRSKKLAEKLHTELSELLYILKDPARLSVKRLVNIQSAVSNIKIKIARSHSSVR